MDTEKTASMDLDITASVDMGPERLAGILMHPTSFPGPYGIGDLGKGAYDFIDFMEKSGMKLWQVLPLGHTGFGDSPYQPFSSFRRTASYHKSRSSERAESSV